MARATCRCGQALEMPAAGVDHTTCPRCSAKVRIIRKNRNGDPSSSSSTTGDGFLRFSCPCGRRLKVSAIDRPETGKCPDCGRVVPVPANATSTAPSASTASRSESPTEELASTDVAMLEAWSKGHRVKTGGEPMSTADMPFTVQARRGEAGLRVCPRCGKPIHLNADTCRACGIPVPKR